MLNRNDTTSTDTTLARALRFSGEDLAANQIGAYSSQQRGIVSLMRKLAGGRRPAFIGGMMRSTTQSLPRICTVTGRVETICESRSGVDSCTLIVYGAAGPVKLPVAPDAAHAFDAHREYTVYYCLHQDVPTLLSAE